MRVTSLLEELLLLTLTHRIENHFTHFTKAQILTNFEKMNKIITLEDEEKIWKDEKFHIFL